MPPAIRTVELMTCGETGEDLGIGLTTCHQLDRTDSRRHCEVNIEDLAFALAAISNAWLIVEAVPEILRLKIDTLADLDKYAPADC
jgi:3-hydroxyacyl-CoA dehydrogenase